MNKTASLLLSIALAAVTITGVAAADSARREGAQQNMIDRGRYLMKIAGCNDCHTPGYAQSGGNRARSLSTRAKKYVQAA